MMLIIQTAAWAMFAVLAHGYADSTQRRVQPSVVLVTAGAEHACALTRDGVAACWGSNESGQLGRGHVDSLPHPDPQNVGGELTFATLSAGYLHTCGITTAGMAYCWGSNQYGQLGDDSRMSNAAPVPVRGNLTFRSIAAGGTHTCATTRDGTAYCWGGNWHGQLGNGSLFGGSGTECCVLVPARVLSDVGWRGVTVGGIHACGVAVDHRAYCWGSPQDGRLGSGAADARNDTVDKASPVAVAGETRFTSIAARSWQTCAVAVDQYAYCWGGTGPPGAAQSSSHSVPIRIPHLKALRAIATGLLHNCALDRRGVAYCWGANEDGQLGDGTTRRSTSPVRVATGHRFKSIAAGGNLVVGANGSFRTWSFSCAVTRATDQIYCWGDNRRGQIGAASMLAPEGPIRVQPLTL